MKKGSLTSIRIHITIKFEKVGRKFGFFLLISLTKFVI